MTRKLKALLLITTIDDEQLQEQIHNEMEKDDPVIDLRFEMAIRPEDSIG